MFFFSCHLNNGKVFLHSWFTKQFDGLKFNDKEKMVGSNNRYKYLI